MLDGTWRWFHDSTQPNQELIYELRVAGGRVIAYNHAGEPLGQVLDFTAQEAERLAHDPAAVVRAYHPHETVIRFDRNAYFRKWEVPYGVR
jgi:hypothetical protein